MLFLLALLISTDSTLVRTVQTAPSESLRVTIIGSGEPIVVVPGLAGNAFAFRKIIPTLNEHGVQVVVIEPLGVGYSSRPSKANYSIASQADRIAAVMDSLHLPPTVLVAHSVSVAMALRLAVQHPGRVTQILAIDGGPDETLATNSMRKAVKLGFFIKIFAGRGRIKSEVRKSMVSSSSDTTWITPEVVDSYTAGPAGDVGAVLRALKGMVNSVEPDSVRPHLHEITIPVRLLIGSAPHDAGLSQGKMLVMKGRLPDFAIDSVPGAGLHIHEENPDAVVQEILRMLGKGGS